MTDRRRVAVILKGYPRLSETFIAQELRALERRGLEILIVSLRRPHDPAVHPVHRDIRAAVVYLPEYLWREPLRVLRAWRRARRLAGYPAAVKAFLADLRRDRSANRLRRFGQALVLASECPRDFEHLHAHFLHTPASVARYAAAMRELPWSVSAHAKDIWTTPAWELEEKLAEASWVCTCTAYGARRLAGHAGDPARVALVYHGLDVSLFPPRPQEIAPSKDTFLILSVGRLVPKKGTDILLEALALLPQELPWRFRHVGGGALGPSLRRTAERLGLAGRIEWLGARPQDEVLRHFREAHAFVLANRIAPDGDRDGVPNVLMEAMSQRLPVVASHLGAVPELVENDRTGLLVPPEDPRALARALTALARDPALRLRLGANGERRVREGFAMEPGIETIFRALAESGARRQAAE